MVKIDFHVHTKASYDCISTLKGILRVAKKRGLYGIAVTDHGRMSSAFKLEKMNKNKNFLIIKGIEVRTEYGDVIGLFLKKKPLSTSFFNLICEIKKQGGLVVLPHPFKNMDKIDEKVLSDIDLIEIQNSRLNNLKNKKAKELAKIKGIPVTAGSDAHRTKDLGKSYLEFTNIKSLTDLKQKLLDGKGNVYGESSPRYIHYISAIIGNIRKKTLFRAILKKLRKQIK